MFCRSLLVAGLTTFVLTVVSTSYEASASRLPASISTDDGTVDLVSDIKVGTNSSSPVGGAVIGSNYVFAADDGSSGNELWITDGTGAGTSLLKNIKPGSASSYPQRFFSAGNLVYFVADDGTHGYELWKTDGTAGGTEMLKDLETGSNGSGVLDMVNYNGFTLFTGYTSSTGYELWKTNGTTAGTVLVKDISAGQNSGQPQELTVFNNLVYFNANDSSYGQELWSTDGTSANTTLVKDIYPGTSYGFPNSGVPTGFHVFGNIMLFTAFDPSIGYELWVTNGNPIGTVSLGDFNTRPNGSQTENFYPRDFVDIGGKVLFRADGTVSGDELWVTDGTTAGTQLLIDINPGLTGGSPNGSFAQGLTLIGNRVYFFANDGIRGYEPWVTDGTTDGTTLLGDINAGGGNSWSQYSPACGFCYSPTFDFTSYGELVLFAAYSAGSGFEPWITNGTSAGTHQLADIRNSTGSSMIGSGMSRPLDGSPQNSWFVTLGGRALFAADSGTTGLELWSFSGLPGSPRSVTASAATTSATISWQAPASVGASPITSYTVTSNPGAFTCSTSTLSCTVTGLLSNQDYTFSVIATTNIGSSAVAATSSRVRTPSPQLGSLVSSLTTVTDIVSGSQLARGQEITALYTGFNPGEIVLMMLASNPVVIGSANADANGNVAITGTVPSNATLGAHHIILYSPISGFGAKQAVTVGATGSGVDPNMLPATGRGTNPALPAFVLMIIGVGLLLGRRRPLVVHHPRSTR